MNEFDYGSVMALYLKLPEVTDQHAFNHRRWDELLESGEMGLYETQRVETDRYGHLVLSPWAIARHGIYQSEAVGLLTKLMGVGRTITECPVSTSDGVKLVDAAWMSRARFEPMREFKVFELAPEICIEVLSPSNTRAEMEEKRDLYFEIGCLEFWTVSAVVIAGRCEEIEYTLAGKWTEPHFRRLLEINGGWAEWSEQKTRNPDNHRAWLRRDQTTANWGLNGFMIRTAAKPRPET